MQELDRDLKKKILVIQKNELTEHFIYGKLSKSTKDPHNKEILSRIADDELKHHNLLKKYTNTEVTPDKLRVWQYFLISRVLGLTFGIKLMERKESNARAIYEQFSLYIAEAKRIAEEEEKHEKELIDLIDEEKLKYVGSMVLGLNDALVELTGVLAGLTLALQNTRLVASVGLITGIAASLSMSASEYLSVKSEGDKNPLKASIYTGSAYIFTVLILIFPYLFFKKLYLSLGFTILNAILIISAFTFYISIAKDMSFKKRFFEMALISLSIAALSFVIGFLVRIFLNIEV
jgi:VIT1/CCC1 family predicted Fe2+/Mn2+ transporter